MRDSAGYWLKLVPLPIFTVNATDKKKENNKGTTGGQKERISDFLSYYIINKGPKNIYIKKNQDKVN